MKTNNVLLIGPPFLYDLVDNEILEENGILPIYSYKNGNTASASTKGKVVFYEELCIEDVGAIIEQTKPDAIVCFNDNFLIQAAHLRENFGIPGISSSEIKKFKIKSQMYKTLERVLPIPKSMTIDDSTTVESIKAILGEGAYFIKPDNLAGAEGTVHIDSLEKLSSWLKNADRQSCQYLIQKYYNLPLVHCELYIQNGEVKYIQARRYSYPNHLFLEGKIISSFPIEDCELREHIELTAKKVAKALNYHNGVMHTEFFLDHDETLIFLETNIRQAGGAINLIHKKRSGISMETSMILLELDKPLPLKENFSEYEICGYIPMQEGRVIGIEIPKLKGHYQFYLRVKLGEICRAPSSASNTAAAFLGESKCLADLLNDFVLLENNGIISYQNVR
ncbi:hypothetical protein ELY21_02350 [Legionella sp. km535]|uniref:ATP-grasp domain-containing protein n=1 Tax=Legionella sp. km535 TaxID=2498107 RepID=UPI000F8D6B96|nr:hypothetical protein [Legionella sp. km535]RUR19919.1 hypothetical protein ELY21_02350 [Legionella sp. km535]